MTNSNSFFVGSIVHSGSLLGIVLSEERGRVRIFDLATGSFCEKMIWEFLLDSFSLLSKISSP